MTFSNRINPRLQSHDYNQKGIYFITICTKDRAYYLCTSVRQNTPGTPPFFELTEIGRIADRYINMIPDHYPGTLIDKYVIMPNHVHMLLDIERGAESEKAIRPTMEIPRIVAAMKRFTNRDSGIKLWQNSYYDHIIRDERDYVTRWKYIDDNPTKWLEDEYYRDEI